MCFSLFNWKFLVQIPQREHATWFYLFYDFSSYQSHKFPSGCPVCPVYLRQVIFASCCHTYSVFCCVCMSVIRRFNQMGMQSTFSKRKQQQHSLNGVLRGPTSVVWLFPDGLQSLDWLLISQIMLTIEALATAAGNPPFHSRPPLDNLTELKGIFQLGWRNPHSTKCLPSLLILVLFSLRSVVR